MTTGLVLSGGGVRGVGHLGAIQVLKELGIRIDCIAGTSAGAIAGAFIAAGYSPQDTLDITKKIKMFDWHTLNIGSLGFLKMHSIEKVLREYLPESYENLHIPLYACATDILNNRGVFFSEGTLIPTILASSGIPVIYEPIKHNGTYYVDGGVVNNLPVEAIRHRCDKIIAVHVNSLSNDKKEPTFKDIVEKSFHLSINQSVYAKTSYIDIFIDPPEMSRFSMFDIKNAQTIFEYVYDYTTRMKDKIVSQLND
ncbi:MAG: patatin-like phospholipase family protein [Bacteroidia bacterium]